MNADGDTSEILSKLIDRVEGRYWGKYRGIVTDHDDPDNLGRIKAKVPRLLDDTELGWALPAFAYGGKSEQGLFAVPDVDAGVWIEFEGGDLRFPIWTGTWYTSGTLPKSATPDQKVLKTRSGHKLVFDDSAGSVAITDSNNNTITMDASQILVTAGAATKIVIDAANIEIVAGAQHPLVFGDQLLQFLSQMVQMFNTHMHPGETVAGAPVTPQLPAPPMSAPSNSLLSQAVKTG